MNDVTESLKTLENLGIKEKQSGFLHELRCWPKQDTNSTVATWTTLASFIFGNIISMWDIQNQRNRQQAEFSQCELVCQFLSPWTVLKARKGQHGKSCSMFINFFLYDNVWNTARFTYSEARLLNQAIRFMIINMCMMRSLSYFVASN